MEVPKGGDRVTIIYSLHKNENYRHPPLLLHTFASYANYGFSKFGVFVTPIAVEEYQLDDEGITWLRGHHLLDSREVAAALTARALR